MAEVMTEKDWQALVLEAARRLGWLVFHTHDSRKSAAGFPDLVLVKPPHVIFAELKSEAGRLSPDQGHWLDALAACGAGPAKLEVHLWRPSMWDEVVEILRRSTA